MFRLQAIGFKMLGFNLKPKAEYRTFSREEPHFFQNAAYLKLKESPGPGTLHPSTSAHTRAILGLYWRNLSGVRH